ncbi:5-formyltetrahydrofolate cyclo-ligase [Novosphingobium sp. LASN5T]|uniref:5-formyltetrahydrofolate cyclo-ligase n=1 Tax=Novosphingobium sp. LASN5T TaxID=2491021 RepID=UPI000F5FC9A9|nr:5-formyltetrahydrofolate cyclo-ligase [Novosphingobium sp. LASN5T]RQW45894.1 5-formyltetrahydrofolate cyclo-ligase [Novosphingobium sp. LASN5T]
MAKTALRKELRAARRAHVAALDPRVRALMLMRPPRPVADLVQPGQAVGLYMANAEEAPAGGYARFFYDAGHTIALPHFVTRAAPMRFRTWASPHIDDLLEQGPYGTLQPTDEAEDVVPDVLFVPLVGFTADGGRLGQGGGHYDRWLEAHPQTKAIGLAWDCQLADDLPREPHDRPLHAVVTPTRLYGPWEEHR